jgi:hypothetical protein
MFFETIHLSMPRTSNTVAVYSVELREIVAEVRMPVVVR